MASSFSSSSSSSKIKGDAVTPQDQVFINFRGVELRYNFVSHLEKCLKRNAINAFTDTDEEMGQELNILLKRIEGSRITRASHILPKVHRVELVLERACQDERKNGSK
ncbi:unnamed protein product [Brassica oleracea var. botrytis]|uniref:TIR domain-containing protein n=2 Tax=Brassica TaxID=3705 RepID=A0A3P6DKU0_BRAOL|nr:unnamed protein product [Brassica napus]CDY15097.1 BnaC03g44580D [Brassica napus]VDD19689.1 unnamed protein product [Brassica oleracea]